MPNRHGAGAQAGRSDDNAFTDPIAALLGDLGGDDSSIALLSAHC
jgi:hypothetical protein